MLATAAAVGAPSVLLAPLGREFGWDAATVSSALAIRLAVFGLASPVSGLLVDAWGVRRTACCGLALTATGLAASLAMTQAWHLVLCWGVLAGAGSGLVSLALGTAVAARWFVTRRGLVIGLFGAAATAGQMLTLPALAAVAEAQGWRGCILASCGLLALATAAMSCLVPEGPGDVGSLPYGARGIHPASSPPTAGNDRGTVAGIARSGLFWALLGSFAVCGASTSGLVQTHLVPLCADVGVGPLQAASLLAGMGALTFVGSAASGWLSDRFDAGLLLFWFYGLRGLSLLCLPFSDLSFVGLSVFAAVYGLDWIATVPPTASLVVARFGRERAARVLGWVFAGHQLGAAAAAYGAGLTRSGMGSYLPAFLAAGAFCLFAAAAILPLSSARRPSVQEPAAAALAAGERSGRHRRSTTRV
ncbi:MFS transporter [Methylobacterium radiodurans]|uniref:MFS transporter n=1 Tax=Methylobacterium radiodurans TaxID=2202828 RepID=UPI001FE59C6C|nr:MFS transporter [Methylobacterium radiodurans]